MRENVDKLPFFEMYSCYDMYNKMIEDYEKLISDKMHPYNLFNFACSANHLKDWITQDNRIKKAVRSSAERKFNPKHNKKYSTIKSMCNRGKHFGRNQYEKPKIICTGYGCGGYGEDGYGEGTTYAVKIDGKIINILDICKELKEQWDKFFIANDERLKHLKNN